MTPPPSRRSIRFAPGTYPVDPSGFRHSRGYQSGREAQFNRVFAPINDAIIGRHVIASMQIPICRARVNIVKCIVCFIRSGDTTSPARRFRVNVSPSARRKIQITRRQLRNVGAITSIRATQGKVG